MPALWQDMCSQQKAGRAKGKRVVKTKEQINPFYLVPPKPDVCQECAVKHRPDEPHDKGSLYYQIHFKAEHRRWPTWEDAMAHCKERIKKMWRRELTQIIKNQIIHKQLGVDGWQEIYADAPSEEDIKKEMADEN